MSGTAITISVIIPTHNRSDALLLTLEHLALQDFGEGWEAIVVNNNSTDNTVEVVQEWQSSFPVELKLVHEKKPGPAAARNAGARAAGGEYLVFIDNDILTEPDFLNRHVETLRANPACWIVGQFPNRPEQEATVFGRYRKHLHPLIPSDGTLRDTDVITGQGTSMPKLDFERLGGFDENFFVASGEDRELAIRAIKSGVKILFDPSIIAIHNDWAGSTIRDYCKRQRIYTQTEPLFALKYGPDNPRYEMSVKNSPPNLKRDGAKLFITKYLKALLGSNAGQAGIIRICEVAERIIPNSGALWSIYKLAIAGAIYRGFNEGYDILNSISRNSGSDVAITDSDT